MAREKSVFFTGFPGFIGKRLVYKILADAPSTHFFFLIQENMRAKAEADIAEIEARYDHASFEIFSGDITDMQLALPTSTYDRLASETTDIFHLAAVYDLSVPEELAWKVNVDGTRFILDFAEQCKKLNKLVYYSTCYVAGKRIGRVYEDELQKGQSYKNFYEETKHEAEVEVRKRFDKIPTIIIRPSIVVGDSKTGETQKFDGPYFIMKWLDSFNMGMPLPFIGESDAYFNIVPIDYVVDGSFALWLKKGNEGTTYALADPHPLKARDLYSLFSEEIIGHRPDWAVPHWLIEGALGAAPLRKLLGIPIESVLYLRHPVEYDCTNTLRDLAGSGVECPRVLDYVKTMVKFYLEHKNEEKFRVKVN